MQNAYENLLNHNSGHPTKTLIFFPFSLILYNLETHHVPSHLGWKLPMYLSTWMRNFPCTFLLGWEITPVPSHFCTFEKARGIFNMQKANQILAY